MSRPYAAVGWELKIGNSTATRFVGSFYGLEQLPRDNRPQIAVAGRSNVGKSSLLNKLLGQKKLAKVSATPGKTQSLNFFLINDKFYLVDLPGYGYARVAKSVKAAWAKLMENYLVSESRLIGLVWLLDCRRDATDEDLQLIEWLYNRQLPVLAVITKADKVNRDQIKRKVQQVEKSLNIPAVAFSIKTGEGKKELWQSVLNLVDTKLKK